MTRAVRGEEHENRLACGERIGFELMTITAQVHKVNLKQ